MIKHFDETHEYIQLIIAQVHNLTSSISPNNSQWNLPQHAERLKLQHANLEPQKVFQSIFKDEWFTASPTDLNIVVFATSDFSSDILESFSMPFNQYQS